MSAEKQIPSLTNPLCPFYEEIFSNKTDVQSQLYHNVVDVSKSNNKLTEIRIGSNKNKSLSTFNIFNLFNISVTWRANNDATISFWSSTRELAPVSKAYESASKSARSPHQKSKVELASTLSGYNIFVDGCKDITDHSNMRLHLPFFIVQNSNCELPTKIVNFTGDLNDVTEIFIRKSCEICILEYNRNHISHKDFWKHLRHLKYYLQWEFFHGFMFNNNVEKFFGEINFSKC